jgi:hypothetical protein
MDHPVGFGCSSALAAATVTELLAREGLAAVRSFDLRSLDLPPGLCSCPHHGTPECNCEYIVLLVYGAPREPVSVTLHGRDGRTDAQLVRDANRRPDAALARAVEEALYSAAALFTSGLQSGAQAQTQPAGGG